MATDHVMPADRIRKYSIIVVAETGGSLHGVKCWVEHVAHTLARAPQLARINIHLQLPANLQGHHTVLEGFKLLHNVRTVTFDEPLDQRMLHFGTIIGTPPEYAQTLKNVIEGPAPAHILAQCYSALGQHSLFPDEYATNLLALHATTQSGDCQEFRRIAEQLIAECDARIKSAQKLLLKHGLAGGGGDLKQFMAAKLMDVMASNQGGDQGGNRGKFRDRMRRRLGMA